MSGSLGLLLLAGEREGRGSPAGGHLLDYNAADRKKLLSFDVYSDEREFAYFSNLKLGVHFP